MGARRTRGRHAHKRKTRKVKRGGNLHSRKRARTPPRRQRTPSPRTPSPIWKRVLRTLRLRG